ncbi:hypothetical protein [Mucilaginibacter phyllosphaerae]|uniref:DUF3575 domain-containing protein n=1 Tax=Mucilaginibacter phyllosphaerae TaxID=1812349 RepID=A0A4Y8AK82_9SPHI|nr:hypothetical protein [Mucilaginibacter phyllosphaerae]MBB3967525.1 hypothetical protein [Mucilaginibacter phyllosphaerae]TEW69413.1 hypothetical protein E2R65_04390 [Mucilaginibacter phyllosphaerae]
MKKFTFTALLLTAFLFAANRLQAQDYKTAVGLKFGAYENGPSVKYFMNSTTALEGILGIRSHGVVITGLYELHQTAFNTPLLKFYYGFGAHLGSVGKGVYKRFGSDDNVYNDSHILLGADGVLGLEYKLPDAPFAFSLDLNPRLELATGPFFDLAPGLGLKYTF